MLREILEMMTEGQIEIYKLGYNEGYKKGQGQISQSIFSSKSLDEETKNKIKEIINEAR